MTTETHSQPHPTTLSHPCTYGQCTSRATWQVSGTTDVGVLATVCDNHLADACSQDMSYTITRLATYEVKEDIILYGVTEKETEILGLALTLAQRDEREIRQKGGLALQEALATMNHAFLLLWQQQSQPPACSFLPDPTVGEVLVARRVAEWPFGGTWWQARIEDGQIEGRRWDMQSSAWLAWGPSNPAWRWLDCRPLTDDVDASPIGRCECDGCRRLLRLRPPPGSVMGILDVLRNGVDILRDAMHLPPPEGIIPSVKALWSDVGWALSYLMQRGVEQKSSIEQKSEETILVNGKEFALTKRMLTREDLILMANPSPGATYYVAGIQGDEEFPVDEGDILYIGELTRMTFKVVRT